MVKPHLSCWLWMGLLLATTGCTSLGIKTPWTAEKIPNDSAKHPVAEVLCLWEPAEGRGLDGMPCRGFAGQVLFFTASFPEPAQVRGNIRVYVFDDQGTEAEQARPIHQFDFGPEAWNGLARRTNVGLSYQVFIPYTRKGRHHAECALRIRYTPEEGSAVYSKLASVVLRGTRPKVEEKSTPNEAPATPRDLLPMVTNFPNETSRPDVLRAGVETKPQNTADSRARLARLTAILEDLPAETASGVVPASHEVLAPDEHEPAEPKPKETATDVAVPSSGLEWAD